jgi:hypothetical protein
MRRKRTMTKGSAKGPGTRQRLRLRQRQRSTSCQLPAALGWKGAAGGWQAWGRDGSAETLRVEEAPTLELAQHRGASRTATARSLVLRPRVATQTGWPQQEQKMRPSPQHRGTCPRAYSSGASPAPAWAPGAAGASGRARQGSPCLRPTSTHCQSLRQRQRQSLSLSRRRQCRRTPGRERGRCCSQGRGKAGGGRAGAARAPALAQSARYHFPPQLPRLLI